MPDYSGGVGALQRTTQNIQTADVRAERLKQARLQTQSMETAATENALNAPVRNAARNLELQQMEMQSKQLSANAFKDSTYRAFDYYEADKDVRHLNNYITEGKRNPVGNKLLQGTVRVDKAEFDPETVKVLKAAGIEDAEGFMADPDLASSVVWVTKQDGTRELQDVSSWYAATGYAQHTANQTLQNIQARQAIVAGMQSGQSKDTVVAKQKLAKDMSDIDPNMSLEDAMALINSFESGTKNKNKSSSFGATELERIAAEIEKEKQAAGEPISRLEALQLAQSQFRGSKGEREAGRRSETVNEFQQAASKNYARELQTTKSKDVAEAASARQALEDAFVEQGGYFAQSPDTLRRNPSVKAQIDRIETLGGNELAVATKTRLAKISQLIGLGDTAKDVEGKDVGIIDSITRDVKKYVTDDLESSTEATAAYEQFNNIVRNSLFGATLTPAETKNFTKAAGSLKEQQLSVLRKFKVSLQSLQGELQGLLNMEDPWVTHYYTGMDDIRLNDAVDNLQDRIDMITQYEKNADIVVPADLKTKEMSDEEAFDILSDIEANYEG